MLPQIKPHKMYHSFREVLKYSRFKMIREYSDRCITLGHFFDSAIARQFIRSFETFGLSLRIKNALSKKKAILPIPSKLRTPQKESKVLEIHP